MDTITDSLSRLFPRLRFKAGATFCWSPETQEVFYKDGAQEPKHIWSLLHETGHALLKHQSYQADVELLKLEIAAWEKAKELAEQLEITIDEEHIQDCLDTYRDWLHARSVCPTCTTIGLQQSDMAHYRCFNCHTLWRVTPARFARPYRATKYTKNQPLVFHAAETL